MRIIEIAHRIKRNNWHLPRERLWLCIVHEYYSPDQDGSERAELIGELYRSDDSQSNRCGFETPSEFVSFFIFLISCWNYSEKISMWRE